MDREACHRGSLLEIGHGVGPWYRLAGQFGQRSC